jgi:hypothetical protein
MAYLLEGTDLCGAVHSIAVLLKEGVVVESRPRYGFTG